MKRSIRLSMVGLMLMIIIVGCASPKQTVEAEKTLKENNREAKELVTIINDYGNTQELLKLFPVMNPTPVDTDMSESIQNRLLTGFANWNKGYEAWEKWGDILYTKDSYYNVHGVRLSLDEYQMAMDMSLKATDIQMGNFNNIILSGDWVAIRYDITNKNRESQVANNATVMEFVKFKDYGEDLGVRVVEGWAGTIGRDFESMSRMQTQEEREEQQDIFQEILDTEIPNVDDLKEKYPVIHPTPIETENAKKIQSAVLNEFDVWNQGLEAWTQAGDQFFSQDLVYHQNNKDYTYTEYLELMATGAGSQSIKRINFNNLIISGDWAAVFYNVIKENKETGEKSVGTVMQFLHFKEEDNQLKIVESWCK